MANKVVIIIPARYSSERLPGKLLLKIGNKPLLYYTFRNALASKYAQQVIIATDSEKIKEEMEKFGATVILTRATHRSGSDRVYEVAEQVHADIIVNLQGDEPLLHAELLDKAISAVYNGTADVATLKSIANEKEYEDPNVVKVVVDKDDFALYFSRAPIPFIRHREEGVKVYKHIGLYVYRWKILKLFNSLQPSLLERIEGLEQLRLLQNGIKIKVETVDFKGLGVDTAEDFKKVKEIIENVANSEYQD